MRSGGITPLGVERSGLCIGCGSCAAAGGYRMAWDRFGNLKPTGEGLDRPPKQFERMCPFSPEARDETRIARDLFPAARSDPWIGRYESLFVGHAAEGDFRERGSSGGITSWLAAELLRGGMVDQVIHVVPAASGGDADRLFTYDVSTSEEAVRRGAKSRYYPVDLAAALSVVRALPGRYAITGVPCFIKALRLLAENDPAIGERIAVTIGLFCGHMKSAHFAESLAWQVGCEPGSVRALDFRVKDATRPANWYRARVEGADGTTREQDWWHLADGDWGAGYFQNSACNYCDDVTAETADIAFGDAWVEPYASDGRGTNVVVVRSPALLPLVQRAVEQERLSLTEVDAAFVRRTQDAGLRHRREGLAYRLTWHRGGLPVKKRVSPDSRLKLRRKLIYRARAAISWWSHRQFALARRLERRGLYLGWARIVLRSYQALAWGRPLGVLAGARKLIDRAFPRA